ncbi:MAG TPA: hypothetical protein VMV07_10505 [Streptosporangiaceae bacterium]|nr:hypothetical protein [Streptosporangiaceae bacterium]
MATDSGFTPQESEFFLVATGQKPPLLPTAILAIGAGRSRRAGRSQWRRGPAGPAQLARSGARRRPRPAGDRGRLAVPDHPRRRRARSAVARTWRFRTDGEWIWTDTVEYYLSRHGLAPDAQLTAHIEARLRRGQTVPGTEQDTAIRAAAFLLHPPANQAPRPDSGH